MHPHMSLDFDLCLTFDLNIGVNTKIRVLLAILFLLKNILVLKLSFSDSIFCCLSEFIPYVFQIMSLMLELHKDCPTPYMDMFPFLLAPVLWERLGNIPPLVRLLQAYVEKGSAQIVATNKVVSYSNSKAC